MSELGSLLKELRGKESLREASKRSGVSHNYLSLLEKGIDPRTKAPIKPSPETLKKLAEAYNYSYEDLLKVAGILEDEGFTEEDFEFVKDLDLTDEEIMEKYNFNVDGVKLTDDEIKGMLAYVRANRHIVEETKRKRS